METLKEADLCFPQLLNTSCRKQLHRLSESILVYTLMSSLSLFTVVLNLLVIISISHFRQLHTPTNYLLLSLAVSDFLVGLVVMPHQILLAEPCWLLGDLLCALYNIFPFIAISASVVNMVLISVDRYVAICYPLRYPTQINSRRVQGCLFLCWVYCVLYSFLILYDNLKQPGRYNSCYGECVINIIGAVDIALSFIIPILAIIILYMRVFVVAVSQARAMRSQVVAVGRRPNVKRSVTFIVKKSELKAARTLGVVVAVFLLCYCPCYCVSVSGYDLMMGSSANFYMYFLVLINSCLNPVIYALFYPWFRKSVKLIAVLAILKPNSCGTKIL